MIGDAYRYGHIAYMDMVDPDKLSLHELNKMVEYLGVYGGIFEYLWLVPGKEFTDGLKPLHCDDDVRDLTDGVTVDKNICVYINKLTEFQARRKLALLQRRMFEVVTKRRGVVIEEVVQAGHSDGLPALEFGSSDGAETNGAANNNILTLEYQVGENRGLPLEGDGTSTTTITHSPPVQNPSPPPSPHVQVPSPHTSPNDATPVSPPSSPPVEAQTPPTSPPAEAQTPPTSPPAEAQTPLRAHMFRAQTQHLVAHPTKLARPLPTPTSPLQAHIQMAY
ncbi:hypothetical protein LINPERHAP1_LOCUS23349 [Linum perenne]